MNQVGLPCPDECLHLQQGFIEGQNISVSYALFPGYDEKNGTLEDLCIKILKQDNNIPHMLKQVNGLLDLLQRQYREDYPRRHKNLLHSVFSVQDKYVGMKIGEATKLGAFDLTHPRVVVYKNMMETLLSGE